MVQISEIQWLQQLKSSGSKSSQSDMNKRNELFHEFLYFVFDSLLMPLLRSNFYITESNVDRNQVFYFRHEVWRHVAEPALTNIKTDMFEEVKMADAASLLNSRRLGYSQIRLLPKLSKLRPIMNLRRRMIRTGSSRPLGPSINSVLAPVHTMLKFEAVRETLGPYSYLSSNTATRKVGPSGSAQRCSLLVTFTPASRFSESRSEETLTNPFIS